MLLSICLTVYNQIDLARQNILEIVKYKGDDIEVVVSDNSSEDPIKEMLEEFQDSRIRYCRTVENMGHDGNILNALQYCRGDYIYLFRTKDIIIPEMINTVIHTIRTYPTAVYFLFSSLDETGKERMLLEDRVYKQYAETQQAHEKLLVHPSGQIYKKECLRLDLYKKYIEHFFPEKNGCDVHQLIRMDLAMKGDFVTSACYTWRHAYTLRSKYTSVIQTEKRTNIYAPIYQYQRYKCEMSFVDNEIPEENKIIFFKQIIKAYGWRIVPFFQQINEDKEYNSHYGSIPIYFSPYKELNRFRKVSLEMIQNIDITDKNKIKGYLLHEICRISFYNIPKNTVRKIVYSNKLLTGIWNKLQGLAKN